MTLTARLCRWGMSALAVMLAVMLALQLWLVVAWSIYGGVPMDPRLLVAVAGDALPQGCSLQVERVVWTTRGRWFFRNLELSYAPEGLPLASLRAHTLELHLGKEQPQSLAFGGLEVWAEPALTPSGSSEALLLEGHGRVVLSEEMLRVERLRARLLDAPLQVRGQWPRTALETTGEQTASEGLPDYRQWREALGRGVYFSTYLRHLDQARWQLHFDGGDEERVPQWRLEGLAQGWELPGEVIARGGPLSIQWQGIEQAQGWAVQGDVRGGQVEAELPLVLGTEPVAVGLKAWEMHGQGASLEDWQLDLAGHGLRVEDLPLDVFNLRLTSTEARLAKVQLSAGQTAGMALWLEGQLAPDRSARAEFSLTLRPVQTLWQLSPAYARQLPAMSFAEPVTVHGQLALGAEAAFERVDFRLAARGWDYAPLMVERIELAGSITPTMLDFGPASVQTTHDAFTAYYQQNLINDDYRVRAIGSVRPLEVSRLVDEDWWDDLWQRFELGERGVWTDFDLFGRYNGGRAHKWLYGAADVMNFEYQDVPLRRLYTRFYLLPETLDLFEFNALAEEGQLEGGLSFRTVVGADDRVHLAVRATSTLPLEAVAGVIGPDAEPFLGILQATSSPLLRGSGLIFGEDSPRAGERFLNVVARFGEPLRVEQVWLDHLSLRVLDSPSFMRIRDVSFGLGGGQGRAGLDIVPVSEQTDRLRVQFNVTDVEHHRLCQALAERFPLLADPDPEGPYAGKVSLMGDLEGVLGELPSFQGQGELRLREADLGEVALLGELTRALQGAGIDFGKLTFTQGQSSLQLRDGLLYLPDVQITGPTAKLEGNGYLNLVDEAVELRAVLLPFGDVTQDILGPVLQTISRLGSIADIRLSGPLQEPEFGVSFRPQGILTGAGRAPEPLPDPELSPAPEPQPEAEE